MATHNAKEILKFSKSHLSSLSIRDSHSKEKQIPRVSNIKWILSKWKLSNVGYNQYWWICSRNHVQCIQQTFTCWLRSTMSVLRRSKWFVWPKWNLASIDRGIACNKPSSDSEDGQKWNLEFRFSIWCWCKINDKQWSKIAWCDRCERVYVYVLSVRASVFVFMLKWSGFFWCELYRNHKSINKCWLFRLESNGCVDSVALTN